MLVRFAVRKKCTGDALKVDHETGKSLGEGATRAWLIPAPPSLDGWKLFGEDAAWLKTQLTPTAVSTFEQRVKLEHSNARAISRSFIRCREFPTFAGMEQNALEAGWGIDRLTCGHFAQLEQPEKLFSILIG